MFWRCATLCRYGCMMRTRTRSNSFILSSFTSELYFTARRCIAPSLTVSPLRWLYKVDLASSVPAVVPGAQRNKCSLHLIVVPTFCVMGRRLRIILSHAAAYARIRSIPIGENCCVGADRIKYISPFWSSRAGANPHKVNSSFK